jgi:hypothetical protein
LSIFAKGAVDACHNRPYLIKYTPHGLDSSDNNY